MESQTHKRRVTHPYLSKYELARVIGTRALQISQDSPIFVETNGESEPFKIAMMELNAGVLPIKVVRKLPNGDEEIWSLTELKRPVR